MAWARQRVGPAGAIGIGGAAVFWLVESALHAYVFDHTTYLEAFSGGTANELWMRSFGMAIIIASSLLVQRHLDRTRQSQARERFLAQAVEQADESILITDADGIIEYVNPSFSRATGYSLKELSGKTPAILQSGLKNRAFYQSMWSTILAGRVWKGDITDKRRDDTFYPAHLTIAPVKNETGVITRFVGIQHDLSERVRFEERLRQAQKLETLGTLTSGIAHDFNNSLAVLTLQLQLASKMTERESVLARSLDEMTVGVDAAASMVRSLVKYARPTDASVLVESVDLHEFLTRIWPALRMVVPAGLETRLETTASIWARIDPAAMQQVLLNLVCNARDALLARGSGTISVSCDEPGPDAIARLAPQASPADYVRIRVADDGPGIPEALRSRIFEPFFTTKVGGSGLGLAMARDVVQHHGGHLVLECPPEGGTQLHILIPAAPAVDARPVPAELEAPPGHGELVLLADDRRGFRVSARLLLESLGYRVIEAADGVEAVDVFVQHAETIKVLLLDALMPRMSGIDAAAQIRKLDPNVPMLIITGLDSVDLEKRNLSGPVGSIAKPFHVELLATRLRDLLDWRPAGG